MSNAEEAKFTLKVMVNKEKTKVLFAEADSHFTDILLSFLTLPLGRIVKVLEKHYGDEAPSIGSLNTLYHSLANLDSAHFCTEGAKMALLDPITLFVLDYECLKLDVSNSPPAKYSTCSKCRYNESPSVSIYYNEYKYCTKCGKDLMKREEVAAKGSQTAAGTDDGAFTKTTTNFIIYDDLHISANVMGLLQTISILGITDMDSAKLMNVSFGLTEIMNLLKASLVSQTPLSDLILSRNKLMTSTTVGFKLETTSTREAVKEEASKSKNIILKMMVQKSSGKLLYAQAEEDFVELLFSFLIIPLGGVECLLAGEASIKSIDNLYRSVADVVDEKYFKTTDTKSRLIKPMVPHGYVSKNKVLPLLEEWVSPFYCNRSHDKFPKGHGIFLSGPITYHVTDDLTVTPFCIASIFSHLSELKVPVSDMKEVEVQIGLEEALSILKASLTSSSALTDGLLRRILIKPKQECGF